MANSDCDDGGLSIQRSLPSTSLYCSFAAQSLGPRPKGWPAFCYAILSWICIFLLKWFSQDRAKVSLLSKSYFIFRFWILEDFLLKIKLSSLVLLMVSLLSIIILY